MKIVILNIQFLLLCYFGYGQGVLVDKTFDFNNNSEWARSVLFEKQTDNYIIGGQTWMSGTFSKALVLKCNKFGDTIWTKTFDFGAGFDYVWASCFAANGNYVFVGTTEDTTQTIADVLFFELDTAGNLSRWKKIGGVGKDGATGIKLTKDGGYIISGYTTLDPNGYEDGLCIKTDSIGNITWQKQFGDTSYDLFQTVDTCKNGYILGGRRWNIQQQNEDLWVLKIDTSGNYLWDHNYGSIEDDYGWGAASTMDGGFVVYGTVDTWVAMDAFLAKADSNGTVIWQKTFNNGLPNLWYREFVRVIQTSDSGYISMGTSEITNGISGILVRYDKYGDTLWTRNYHLSPDTIYPYDYFYGFTLTSDSSYAICGMITTLPPSTSKNDLWFKVVDSLGCETTLCQGINGIEELQASASIYPNPARDKCSLAFYKSIDVNSIFIYQPTGKLIKTVSVNATINEVSLDVSSMSNGLYFVKVIGNGIQSISKLIIVH